ncbi:hypothetical protein JCM8547_003662 [Rhodosporidiobolus lusitaniae]
MSDQAFLDVGVHCAEPACHQLDFLPFKCPCCRQNYCHEHWRPPAGHACANHDPALADNRIPSCPLCSTPISTPSSDPNIPMDHHLSTSCVVLHPHLASQPKPKPANECSAQKCKTKMIQPIQCEKCRLKYCPKHRFERDHACPGAQTAAAAGGGGAGVRKAFGALRKVTGGTGVKTSMSGLAALRRAQQAASSSFKPSTTPSTSKPAKPAASSSSSLSSFKTKPGAPGSASNPFVLSDDDDSDVQIVSRSSASRSSKPPLGGAKKALASTGAAGKVNKRAAQEQESARKALEARAKKGLLTEDEKVRYATLQALSSRKGSQGGGDGCSLA